nr:choice-of-anchor J domain-containing protein [Candidatus Poribacteria bacterium]
MNIIKHNMSRMALCMLFFVVSIQAADKNELKNNKETNNEKQNNTLPAETPPLGYVEPTQPAEGIKFAFPPATGSNPRFSAQKETGIKSNNGFLHERVDDSIVERIINKYLQGEPLTTHEKQILRNNINEIPYPGDGVFRPSITETSAVSRNASDLFFSEYSEGSGNNKYLEIYNGTGESADLSNYLIRYSQNGASTWNSTELGLSGTLLDGEVYVVAHSSADATILAEADTTESSISAFNGDDVRGLFKVADNDTSIIDIIGTQTGGDPGSGWDVAGVTNATKDHTLVRKSSVSSGNTNWSTSAGTTTDNSEWIVYDLQTWSYLGSHTMILPNLLSEGFESGSIPENWSLLNLDNHSANWYAYESSFYAHSGNFLARVYYRPLSAAPQNQPSDDWLITPKLDVVSGDSISFWARSSNSNPYESFNVRVSSTNAESAASFTDTLASVATVPTTWTRHTYALESYVGQDIYIAVQHNTYDGWYLYVDDFSGPQVWIDDSPVIALNKDSINYGNTGLGGMSESVVIENLGASDLVVSSVASSNSDFTISTSSLTLTGGGDLETITITYTPTAVEGDTAHVVFTHNGSTSPDSIVVMGAGKDAIYWQDFESW